MWLQEIIMIEDALVAMGILVQMDCPSLLK